MSGAIPVIVDWNMLSSSIVHPPLRDFDPSRPRLTG
jgi:hypothetical protein